MNGKSMENLGLCLIFADRQDWVPAERRALTV